MVPDRYAEAAEGMRRREYFSAERHLGDTLFSTVGMDPRMVKFAAAFIETAQAHKIPLRLFCGYRSHAQQQTYYDIGTSKAKPGQSAHNYGLAVDIIHATEAWDLKPNQWKLLGVLGNEVARRQNLKVTWGGDWKFYDPAHWEIKGWQKDPARFRQPHHAPPKVDRRTSAGKKAA